MITPSPPRPHAFDAVPLLLHAQLATLATRHDLALVTGAGPDPSELTAADSLVASGLRVWVQRRATLTGLDRWRRRGWMASNWLGSGYPRRILGLWQAGMQALLDGILSRHDFDLIHIEDNAMAMYDFHTPAPIILTEHEVKRPRPIDRRRILRAGRSWPSCWVEEADWQRWQPYQLLAWRKAGRVQVFSPRDAGAIGDLDPRLAPRVRVNPFGMAAPAAADPDREQEDSIVFVGNYRHPPTLDAARWLVTEIMPRLRTRAPGVRVTLVGHGGELLRCPTGADVTVTGSVPSVTPYLEAATVVVAPVRIGGGQRMKVLEAIALGKAVVTTTRGIEGLTIDGHPPPVVVADQPDAIAEAIARLLRHRSRRQALGERARAAFIEHFTVEAYCRRTEATYEEVLASRPVVR
jgi:polysaccharide biosynthesis protein PslH